MLIKQYSAVIKKQLPFAEHYVINLLFFSDQCQSSGQETQSFGRVQNFMTFKRLKGKKWKESVSKKGRGREFCKTEKMKSEEVKIYIGLAEWVGKNDSLKKRHGKRVQLKVNKRDPPRVILEKALAKWKDFKSDCYCEEEEYVLLLEDFKEALFLPGTYKEFFTIERYQEVLGKDYKNITLYLCTNTDFVLHQQGGDVEELDITHPDQECLLSGQHSQPSGLLHSGNESSRQKASSSNPAVEPCTDLQESQAVNQSEQETLFACGEDVMEDFQDFMWGMMDDDVGEEELVKAAIARSLEEEIRPIDDMKLVELLESFRKQVKNEESCEIVVLRRKLLKTCLKAVTESTFDFFKTPLIHFSGEDAEDCGGPRREFFRLLMKTLSSEFVVFEGRQTSLVFSHNH